MTWAMHGFKASFTSGLARKDLGEGADRWGMTYWAVELLSFRSIICFFLLLITSFDDLLHHFQLITWIIYADCLKVHFLRLQIHHSIVWHLSFLYSWHVVCRLILLVLGVRFQIVFPAFCSDSPSTWCTHRLISFLKTFSSFLKVFLWVVNSSFISLLALSVCWKTQLSAQSSYHHFQ